MDVPVPRLSVVIPTFRRPELLARCLDALLVQTLPGEAFEVIVVDDGCTEDTRAACDDGPSWRPSLTSRIRPIRGWTTTATSPRPTAGRTAPAGAGW